MQQVSEQPDPVRRSQHDRNYIMNQQKNLTLEHLARASAKNVVASAKHCVEISKALRYKTTSYAKQYLESVIQKERTVPFTRFYHNVGHRVGMSAGRYPVKAAKEFLALIKSVEANAQVKGFNTAHLKIVKLISNKASTPFTGGRFRTKTKRSHIDIVVAEAKAKESKKKGTPLKKPAAEKKVKPS